MPRIPLSLFIALFAGAALLGCDTTVRRSEMQAVEYGPKPERWREEIRSYLGIRLTDPKNAVVEFRTEPKIMFQKDSGLREQQHGWAVCVWVNDKNRSGAFEGFYPMTVFLRNEKIVAVNNGPDDFGVIGAQYARQQCSELGAPFKG
jgi:hypothetical protein